MYDSNIRIPTAVLMTPGTDYSSINTLFSHMNIPVESHSSFDAVSKKIGEHICDVAKESEIQACNEEKNLAILDGVQANENNLIETAVSYDGTWSKRSYKHSYNSLIGGGVAIGKYTKKILDHEVKVKQCAICMNARKINSPPNKHKCSMNWTDSAKSMESGIALSMWKRAPEKGLQFKTLIGDEDSCTLAKLKSDLPKELADIEKSSDHNHIVKLFATKMHTLKEEKYLDLKGILSVRMIDKLGGDFSYAIKQHVNDANGLKLAFINIVEHNYGNHQQCEDWCGFKSSPLTYKPQTGFPLTHIGLKEDLQKIISHFSTPEALSKISKCGSTQGNESFHSLVHTLAPKHKFYGKSSLINVRWALAVCRKNKGRGFGTSIWDSLKLKQGYWTNKSYSIWNHLSLLKTKYSNDVERKKRRKQLKRMRKNQNPERESKVYENGIALNTNKRKRRSKQDLQNSKKFKCTHDGCTNSYTSKSNLNVHIKSKHPVV